MSRWIFLRGLMRESRHWGNFPMLFKEHCPEAHVALPDLPGNGVLYRATSPARIARMVDYYRSSLVRQNFHPPYGLLALSLGAMIAVEWARRYPAELEACVLINTSLRPFSPFYRRLYWRNYQRILSLASPRADALAREQLIMQLTSSTPEKHAATLCSWVAYRHEYPVSATNALRQLMAAARYTAPDSKPAVPMLVLGSSADRLVHPSCSRILARKWSTGFAVHPTAGHDLPLDDGAWVAMQVSQWVTRQAGR